MQNQKKFLRKEDLKRPPVLFFIVVYFFALLLILLKHPLNALLYIGLSIGILFLCWLIIDITKKIKVSYFEIKRPDVELFVGLLILLIWDIYPLPKIDFGDKWDLGPALTKLVICAILPIVFLKLRKNSFASMGLSLKNWKKNLGIGVIIFLAMAIPSAFFVGNTGSLIIKGKLSLAQFVIGFFASFAYYFLMSGFSEEVLFRAFIQTRFSKILKSSMSGILITSLIFGLVHIEEVMRLNPQMTIFEAFPRVMFLHAFIGIVFGLLWERTRSLIPCVFLHSAVNGLNNIGFIVSKFGL